MHQPLFGIISHPADEAPARLEEPFRVDQAAGRELWRRVRPPRLAMLLGEALLLGGLFGLALVGLLSLWVE